MPLKTERGRNVVNWDTIRSEYITTNQSYRQLAKKYQVSIHALEKNGSREGWVAQRHAHREKGLDKVLQKDIDRQVERVMKIRSVTDRLLEKLEQAVTELDKQLCKQVQREQTLEYEKGKKKNIKETQTESITQVPCLIDRQGVKQLAAALRDIKEVQMLRSQLDIREQQARIEKLERQSQESTDGEDSLEVIFSAGPEAWNE